MVGPALLQIQHRFRNLLLTAMAQRLHKLSHSWALHYACRSRADMAFVDALAEMGKAHFHFDDENQGKVLDVGSIVAAAPRDAHL